jgi:hypothetical protein
MKHFVKPIVSALIAAVLILFTVDTNEGEPRDGRGNRPTLSRTLERGHYVVFDVKSISTFIRNNGSFNRNPESGNQSGIGSVQ